MPWLAAEANFFIAQQPMQTAATGKLQPCLVPSNTLEVPWRPIVFAKFGTIRMIYAIKHVVCWHISNQCMHLLHHEGM